MTGRAANQPPIVNYTLAKKKYMGSNNIPVIQ